MALPLKPLSIDDRPAICAHVRQFSPYSDFAFTNLWAWYNVDDHIRFGFINENLVVEFIGHEKEYHFYSFLGNTRVNETVDTLLDASIQAGIQPVLELIPHGCVTAGGEELAWSYDIQEDRDQFDYIYSLEKIIQMEGSANSSKCRAYNKFLRDHGEYQAARVDLRDREDKDQIVALMDTWYQQKGGSGIDVGHEHLALCKLMRNAERFDLESMGIFYEGQMIGLFVGEVVGSECVMGHFKKADYRFAGIFEVLEIEMAKHFIGLGRKYLNEQQDLGITGLRRSKMSWNPIRFLKKYRVSAR